MHLIYSREHVERLHGTIDEPVLLAGSIFGFRGPDNSHPVDAEGPALNIALLPVAVRQSIGRARRAACGSAWNVESDSLSVQVSITRRP
jgi:hypothetical protein